MWHQYLLTRWTVSLNFWSFCRAPQDNSFNSLITRNLPLIPSSLSRPFLMTFLDLFWMCSTTAPPDFRLDRKVLMTTFHCPYSCITASAHFQDIRIFCQGVYPLLFSLFTATRCSCKL